MQRNSGLVASHKNDFGCPIKGENGNRKHPKTRTRNRGLYFFELGKYYKNKDFGFATSRQAGSDFFFCGRFAF